MPERLELFVGGFRLLAHLWGFGLAGVSDSFGAPWHFEWRFVIYAVALLRVIPEFQMAFSKHVFYAYHRIVYCLSCSFHQGAPLRSVRTCGGKQCTIRA